MVLAISTHWINQSSQVRSITSNNICSLINNCNWSIFLLSADQFDITKGLLTLTKHLQEAINEINPKKILIPCRRGPPWISPDLQLLLDESNATHRKYQRKGSSKQKFLRLSKLEESRIEAAQCAYMNSRISDFLNKNVWKELKNLGLFLSSSSALHGFTPEELNSDFSNISISPSDTS